MKRIRFEGIIRGDRNAAIRAAAEAVTGSGGWIIDHALYSDMMAVLSFAIDAGDIPALARALRADIAGLEGPAETPEGWDPREEVRGSLSLTFAEAKGELRHEVPAVD